MSRVMAGGPAGPTRRRIASAVLVLSIPAILTACGGGSGDAGGLRQFGRHPHPAHRRATHQRASRPRPVLADPAASWPVIDGPHFSTHMVGVPRRRVLHRGSEAQVTQFDSPVIAEQGDSVLAFEESDGGSTPRATLAHVVADEHGRFVAERDLTFDGYPVVAAEVAVTGRYARHDWVYFVDAAPRRIELLYLDQAPYRSSVPPELSAMVTYLQLHNA